VSSLIDITGCQYPEAGSGSFSDEIGAGTHNYDVAVPIQSKASHKMVVSRENMAVEARLQMIIHPSDPETIGRPKSPGLLVYLPESRIFTE
jgi:hypothetical protein